MNVAEYIALFIKNKGIDVAFGYSGRCCLKLIQEFEKQNITFVHAYHEQGAGLSADGLARLTGKVGVAIVTSGPGVTNLLTAVATSYFDSVPVLYLTGQENVSKLNLRNRSERRQYGFQDVDVERIATPISKYFKQIRQPAEIIGSLDEAFYSMLNGRPGPAVIDLPLDIQFSKIDVTETKPKKNSDTKKNQVSTKSFDQIMEAKRPVVLVGAGARIAAESRILFKFLQRYRLPVVSTLAAVDLSIQGLGFAGVNGTPVANYAIRNSDLIFALGVRFGPHHIGKVPSYTSAKILRIDTDQSELKSGIIDSLNEYCSVEEYLENVLISGPNPRPKLIDHWVDTLEKKKKHSEKILKNSNEKLNPVRFVANLTELSDQNAVFFNDVGQSQLWLAQGFKANGRRRLLTSTGHAAMGFSLPAAIGAFFDDPNREIIACMGDGGLQINVQELMQIGRNVQPIKIVVFNNSSLGMIDELQDKFYEGSSKFKYRRCYAVPNLKSLCRAYGIGYKKLDSDDDLEAIKKFLKSPKSAMLELVVSQKTKLLYSEDYINFLTEE